MKSDSTKTEKQATGKAVVKADTDNSKEKDSTATAGKSEPKSKTQTKHDTKKQRIPISKIALLALFLVFMVGGAVGYEYYQLLLQSKQDSDLLYSQRSLTTRIARLEQELQNTRTSLTEENKILKSTMDTVSQELGRTTKAWRVAEIEYLLTVANHRLNLVHDRKTAIIVFETADQRLAAIADPGLTSVRKAIASELTTLRSISDPDLTGMALSVGSLADEVEKLPLLFKERVDMATGLSQKSRPESWRDIPSAMWEDIKGLVVVRRHQQPTEPLLPPAEAWFLYQNLRLKLEQAQLSLLRRDTRLFRYNLEDAHKWIQTFFDADSTVVKNANNVLDNLSSVELNPEIPDVSGSLRELRHILSQRGASLVKTGE